MTIKKRRLTAWLWQCQCERCGHRWESKGEEPPERCPGCGARNWNRPARQYQRRKAGGAAG